MSRSQAIKILTAKYFRNLQNAAYYAGLDCTETAGQCARRAHRARLGVERLGGAL